MMSPEQVKTVIRVYNHLIESEKRGWDGIDDYMDYLEYLEDSQLCREASVAFSTHSVGTVRCDQDHPIEKCFVPILIDAVGYILELYETGKSLHIKNKYILQYYLAMNQSEMIIVESMDSKR